MGVRVRVRVRFRWGGIFKHSGPHPHVKPEERHFNRIDDGESKICTRSCSVEERREDRGLILISDLKGKWGEMG